LLRHEHINKVEVLQQQQRQQQQQQLSRHVQPTTLLTCGEKLSSAGQG
jgi:hypothetical protein